SSQRRETRGGPCKFAPSMGATQSPAARNHFQPASPTGLGDGAALPAAGSFVPQPGQFIQLNSTPFPQFGHVGCVAAPHCGQNVCPGFTGCEQFGHGFGSGSRSTKERITPIEFGMNIASSVHIT